MGLFKKKITKEEAKENERYNDQMSRLITTNILCPHCEKVINRSSGFLVDTSDMPEQVIFFGCPHCKKLLFGERRC